MSTYVPIIALTAAAVGWVLVFWEKRKNAGLRRKLDELEASYASQATSRLDDQHDAIATTKEKDNHLPLPEEPTDELSLQIAALKQEMEAEEHDRLLKAEDLHLQTLKDELEALRKGMQEDLKAAARAEAASGRSTPQVLTPARSLYNGAEDRDDTDSMHSESRCSPSLQTPSPPQHGNRHHNTTTHKSSIHHPRLRAHSLTPSTSGTTTPLTPHSPLSTTQLASGEEYDVDALWLDGSFSPSPCTSSFSALSVSENARQPEVAVAPPLPPLNLPVPFAGLDAALTAAFEEGSLDLDDWGNDEEWLMKTHRRNNKENDDGIDSISTTNTNTENAPLIVRPLPKVTVPRLNLSIGSGSSLGGGPLTLSARGGIKDTTTSTAAGTKNAFEKSQNTARRQQQLTSRLSISSITSTSPAAAAKTPRTARRAPSSNNTSPPSGSLTERRNKSSVSVSPSSSSTTTRSSSNSAAPGRDGGSVTNRGHSPSLFSKSTSGGAAARRDAPTPRLVFGSTKPATQANSPSPNKNASNEMKAFPVLRRSQSNTSVASNSTTEGGSGGDSVGARPPTKIPRLQLPLV